PGMPDDLSAQLPHIRRIVEGFRIPCLLLEGYEADDVIGTVAQAATGRGLDVIIVTGDKDMLQLVSDRVSVLDTMKDRLFTPAEVRERFGVEPAAVVEVMGLMGDAIDNIPGIPGVGEKTAIQLVQEFGTIERLLQSLDRVKGKRGELLARYAEQARMSRDLALIRCDVPLPVEVQELKRQSPAVQALAELFRELEFSRFLKELPRSAEQGGADYRTVTQVEELEAVVRGVREAGRASLILLAEGEEPMRARLVGVGLAVRAGQGWYVPVDAGEASGPPAGGGQGPPTGGSGPSPVPGPGPGPLFEARPAQRGEAPAAPAAPLRLTEVLAALGPVLNDPAVAKLGHDLKFTAVLLARLGIELRGLRFDTMIASYVHNPSRATHALPDLALEFLGYRATTAEELLGSGAKARPVSGLPPEPACAFACEQADLVLRLEAHLAPELARAGLARLFREVEMPLVEVLAGMERTGVRVDRTRLERLSAELDAGLEELTATIHELAGEPFNINSPKQLQEILFHRLKLPVLKRIKTGSSTDVEVLEKLAEVHPLPARILEYRDRAKLKSTYTDALVELIHPETGRIHTSFNQTVAATGRLSSSNPNLQNIPIRTELGRKIRAAFVAEPGWRILSADYSQIELRILALLSRDPKLVEAFRKDEDIHAQTAQEVLGVPPELTNAEVRRRAKAVNYGIIYGISPFGLAKQIDAPQEIADEIIRRYFATYEGVRAYRERVLAEARERGYVTTLLGRRRFLPELKSENLNQRLFGERMAINTPLQGTAADLIKVAMVRIAGRLRAEARRTRMVLQVHDELVFEVPDPELEAAQRLVRAEMEGVMALVRRADDPEVPLKADLGVGTNWEEAH
ncbi:MAG: DNA polymerase I, partial [Deltaproteobacteria bacterium]|nr:DNA polymerase I [Deltaproteobacteria bacterium]